MNKAFTREPDQADPHCPRCGSIGVFVGPETLRAFVAPDALNRVTESAYFCSGTTCDVVYFDQFGRTVEREAVTRPVYPKDPDAPICGCFGVPRDAIEQDVREGVVTRSRELVARAKSDEARCAVMAADGRSCIAEVQRYFMQRRAEQEQSTR